MLKPGLKSSVVPPIVLFKKFKNTTTLPSLLHNIVVFFSLPTSLFLSNSALDKNKSFCLWFFALINLILSLHRFLSKHYMYTVWLCIDPFLYLYLSLSLSLPFSISLFLYLSFSISLSLSLSFSISPFLYLSLYLPLSFSISLFLFFLSISKCCMFKVEYATNLR